MKRKQLLPNRRFATLATIIGLCAWGIHVQASVIFEDDFNNNDNGWSSIGTASGEGTIGTDPGASSASVLYASNNDNIGVTAGLIMTNQVNIANGDIDVFMRVRVDLNGGSDNRFVIALKETGSGGRFASLTIRPGHTSYMQGLNSSGATITSSTTAFSYPDFVNFVDFRMTLSSNGDGSMDLEAFKKTSTDSDFVSFITLNTDFSSGVFDDLSVYIRNGTDKPAYFDSVSVEQVPEPATISLFAIFSVGILLFRRSRM